MNETPSKRVWEPTPRIGPRFVRGELYYEPVVVIFTEFDKQFLHSCGWSATKVV